MVLPADDPSPHNLPVVARDSRRVRGALRGVGQPPIPAACRVLLPAERRLKHERRPGRVRGRRPADDGRDNQQSKRQQSKRRSARRRPVRPPGVGGVLHPAVRAAIRPAGHVAPRALRRNPRQAPLARPGRCHSVGTGSRVVAVIRHARVRPPGRRTLRAGRRTLPAAMSPARFPCPRPARPKARVDSRRASPYLHGRRGRPPRPRRV
jgi:hypothetical protein